MVASSVAFLKGNRLIHFAETIGTVQGLAPDTLCSLEKLAKALDGDSNCFQTIAAATSDKADKSTTYRKTAVDSLLDAKVDDAEIINCATTATTYARAVIDNKFTNIINGSPDALNALKVLSDALGADANLSTTVLNKISSESNQFTVSSAPLLLF